VRFRLEALGYNDGGKTARGVLAVLLRCGGDPTRTDFKVVEALHSEAKLDRAIACWIVKVADTIVYLTPPFHGVGKRSPQFDLTWDPIKDAIARKVVELRWIPVRDAPLFSAVTVAVLKQFKDDREAFTSRMQKVIPSYDAQFTSWVMHIVLAHTSDHSSTGQAVIVNRIPRSSRRLKQEGRPLAEQVLKQLNGEATASHCRAGRAAQFLVTSVVAPAHDLLMLAAPILFAFALLDSAVRSMWRVWLGQFSL